MRNRAERRKNDYKHIARKRKIISDICSENYAFDNQLHRLSKNKIPNVKNKKDGYSHSDLKKLAAIDYEE